MLIAGARRRIKQEAWRRLRSHDLTPPQFGVLMILGRERDISLSGMAEHLGIDAPTACRIVRNLEKRKLIRAEVDAEDRRRFRLKLTPSGNKLAKEVVHVKDQLEAEITKGLTAEEKGALISGLKKIIGNVEQIAGECFEKEGKARAKRVRAGGRRR